MISVKKILTVEEEQLTQSYTESYAASIKISIQSQFPEEMLSVIGTFSNFNIEDFLSYQNSQQLKVHRLKTLLDLIPITKIMKKK